ncbi:MAG TPA: enoyl-CoA hydratase-related protein [Bryobacteraceae bacterium]|nr:enoyl-CoA hydratase-related protein [Bryobacteraceae bacterium]
MSEILEVEQQGHLLHLTLNRPEKRNALSSALCVQLVDAFDRAQHDPQIGAVLLSANGKAFCAGMDLEEVEKGEPPGLHAAHEQLFTVGSRFSKPLVGAVGGAALGGGTGLVANCHVALASDAAVFGLTEIRLGLWPFLVFRSVELAVGERRAVELSLTGRTFDAAEAKLMGLVHEVIPAANLAAHSLEIATALANSSPSAIRSGMTYVQEARGKDWKVAGDLARRIRDEVFHGEEFREGLRAFREKRQPKW